MDTCDSCSKVIAEFANKYKNIELEVIRNNDERLKL
ncbi:MULTISPECIES: deaminase domain-containing protein [Bacillus]|nr:deaminase domain-containing protein [Bacillus cereus]